ncbi:hypothetical protein DRH27_02940 [Candidatus Falkowbacteria bacterium]|nr:MAG: hypothetical protein DRH27_02940 [Candidatus Falkowbacteria bacterium]
MLVVDILETQKEGSQKVIGQVFWDGEKITVSDSLGDMMDEGFGTYDYKTIKPKDGKKFIDGLASGLSGSMIRATLPRKI